MPCILPRFALIIVGGFASVVAMCGQIPAAQAASGAPVGPLATARLIAAPAGNAGHWTVGVVVTLMPRAITYWRTPGEAGVPPSFDFSGSTNVVDTSVSYPVPKRISEGDIDAIGYEGEVVFPVDVSLRDLQAGANLHVKFDYATCERICLPAHADLVVDLPARASSSDADLLQRLKSQVPRVLGPSDIDGIATITREADNAWRVVPKAAGARDLFAEAAEGFFVATKRDGSGFRVTVTDHPADRALPDTIRLTLDKAEPVEFSLTVRH